jgi:hypothetical protein
MISKTAIAFFLAASAQGAWARLNKAEVGDRVLMLQLSSKMEWPECAALNLTAEACKTLIETEVQTHHLPNIEVDIIFPRTEEVAVDSYWKVGIQTNIEGIVVGQSVDGVIRWPGIWEGTGELGFRNIGDWNCGKWNPVQCCNIIQADVPDRDVNGNYLECFATQDDPAPYVTQSGGVGYCSWSWDNTAKVYNPVDISLADLEAADTFLKSMLTKNIKHLTAYIRDLSIAFDDLEIVNNSCHLYGRTVPALQSLCNDMDKALHPPNVSGGTIEVNAYLLEVLTELKTAIVEFVDTPYEVQHKVAIYSGNADGDFVSGSPMLGGKPNGPACIPLL